MKDNTGITMKFKTNIKCNGCIAQVSPVLKEAEGISHWKVDTAHEDRILTVHSQGISESEIQKAVQKAGFNIEVIDGNR
jgi:copper chaperone